MVSIINVFETCTGWNKWVIFPHAALPSMYSRPESIRNYLKVYMNIVTTADVCKDEKFQVKRNCIVGSFILHYLKVFSTMVKSLEHTSCKVSKYTMICSRWITASKGQQGSREPWSGLWLSLLFVIVSLIQLLQEASVLQSAKGTVNAVVKQATELMWPFLL